MSKIHDTQATTPLPSLLVLDDSQEILEQMRWGLKTLYTIFQADNRESAVEILQRKKMAVVILDLGLPPDPDGVSEGLSALEQLIRVNPFVKIVVITGNQDRANALKAVQLGAYDFMDKPVDLEVLKMVLQRAGYLSGLEKENQKLLEREEKRGFPDIIGTSPVIEKVFDMIRRVAGSDISVLIVGASGTGKELWHGLFTSKAIEKMARLSQSTVEPFQKRSWKASYSVMKREHLPVHIFNVVDELNWLKEALSFLMKLGKFLRPCKSNSFVFYKSTVSNVWVAE